MFTASHARFATLCLALTALGGCAGSPTSPSEAGATIAGTVTRSTPSSGLTVAVVGSDLSAVVETSGHFQIDRVPAGDVQLKFKDARTDATARVSNVVPNNSSRSRCNSTAAARRS